MDVIVLQAVRKHGDLDDGCSFEISTDGGQTFTAAQKDRDNKSFVSLPSAAQAASITIRARPTDPKYWAGVGKFRWAKPGSLVREDAAPELFFVHGTVLAGPDSVTVLYFHLTIFRDVSRPMLDKLKDNPNDWPELWLKRYDIWPPTAWLGPAPAFYGVISPDVVVNGNVTFIPETRAAATEVTLLQRKGAGVVPELFAVGWPAALPRTAAAGATPFLVFFTHQLNQNVSQFKHLDHYPDSWDYLHLAIYQYLNYARNPLDVDRHGQAWRGLCYQLSISQKAVALVLPVGNAKKPEGEVGDCLDAAKLEDLLLEIQAFFFKRAGLFRPPVASLGRAAMASFSSGNNEVTMFLASSRNASHRFYLNTLREVYSLDNPRDFAAGWAGAAQSWAARGKEPDQKIIRIYGTHAPAYVPIHQALLGVAAPAAPYVSSSPNGTRTVTVLPEASWQAALFKPQIDPHALAGYVHELCCATLLTDALRRSPGF